jgi:hypothetical protein
VINQVEDSEDMVENSGRNELKHYVVTIEAVESKVPCAFFFHGYVK